MITPHQVFSSPQPDEPPTEVQMPKRPSSTISQSSNTPVMVNYGGNVTGTSSFELQEAILQRRMEQQMDALLDDMGIRGPIHA